MKQQNDVIIESVLKIGSISEVKGRNIIVRVDKHKNAPHLILNGEVVKNVSVGSFIKITKGFNEIIGKIEGEYISEDKTISHKDYSHFKDKIKRFLNVTLVGFIENETFKQGLKELPLIENECYLLTQDEFDCIHSFAKIDDDKIKIGTLLNETSVEIKLGVDKLFASHIGIFGNTGSGKSYSLAKIYHELLSQYKDNKKFKENAKFVLIDFNGEYAINQENDNIIIDKDCKKTFFLSTDDEFPKFKFPINKDIIYDTTFWSILLRATEQTQKPFLDSTFKKKYLLDNINSEEGLKQLLKSNLKLLLTQFTLNQDKNFHIFFLEELLKFGGNSIFTNLKVEIIDFYQQNLNFFADRQDKRFYINNYNGNNYSTNSNVEEFINVVINDRIDNLIIDISKISEFQKIKLLITFNYFYSIQKGYVNRDHISPLIGRLDSKVSQANKVFEVDVNHPQNQKLLTVISLKDVNVEMRKLIPLVVCKQYYDSFKETNDKSKYLNIIIDEAHNILSKNSIRESETWKDYRLETFEEIIKEGRKFGVFLTIASQRPSDISDTIISQLHNYFLHRLINNKDIEAIGKTVSYLDKISFDSLPILPQGACILAGLSADLPVIIKIDEILDENKPNNETIILTKNWKDNT